LTLDKKKGRLAPFPRFGEEVLVEEKREFIARSLGSPDTKIRGVISENFGILAELPRRHYFLKVYGQYPNFCDIIWVFLRPSCAEFYSVAQIARESPPFSSTRSFLPKLPFFLTL
jgi:hypothetical protein